ncbi:LruC domain-containing protein [Vibrio sp. vnigr-6D03]|uniref:LruC domain-containing protein n=1 Tax=Vibrio sp. vnigr-6D03 TaxID=2058088 RepID=UPI000C31CA64|nr:LruC domain-containing protein [Vibrio sp. vnigr-6D03]PKF77647.1 LruC domain-containing protein [Vibrio sp. vnigr-6D03]
MKKRLVSTLTLAIIGTLPTYTSASTVTSFDTCPSKAFLFQSEPIEVWGVNLVTGSTEQLNTSNSYAGNINGVGFDFGFAEGEDESAGTDKRFIYGYDTKDMKIVRVGKNYNVQVLNVTGLPSNTFFVGDVYNRTYYLYRKNVGLYKIDLTPLDSDPNATLSLDLVSANSTVNLTDFAFHPGNGKLYGVDNNTGKLHEFATDGSGTISEIGDVGQLGTFGAGYFDVDGYYYVSRNSDVMSDGEVIREGGKIYRIDLTLDGNGDIDPSGITAVDFASGPTSNQNDGARCANAPIIGTDSGIDFGDAPDAYSTLLASNGPRHEIDGTTWMGVSTPDGDADAAQSPSSDNTIETADEDGVGFVTSIEPGLDSVITVYASTSGTLNAWMDWEGNNQFTDSYDQIITDYSLTAGLNTIVLSAPITAVAGSSWSRFRFSQQSGLGYFGGSTSGEVEDHIITISDVDTREEFFPSNEGYVTLAYEDNWPETADYDMNDFVARYQIKQTLKTISGTEYVAKSVIKGTLDAVGASYRSGFAVNIPGIDNSNIDTTKTRLYHNGSLVDFDTLESSETTETTFIIIENARDAQVNSCSYFRTVKDCREDVALEFELHVSYVDPTLNGSIAAMPYKPFIFGTPGYPHGSVFNTPPGRSLEIHLPDNAPTSKFDTSFFDLPGEDDSNTETGKYYKTSNNLPWAIMLFEDAEVDTQWIWPTEGTDLLEAYPNFQHYTENGGNTHTDWFEAANAVAAKCY